MGIWPSPVQVLASDEITDLNVNGSKFYKKTKEIT